MQVGTILPFGLYEWRVLAIQGNLALLMTENIIGQRPYHNHAGDVTWAQCELRAYLNGEFYAAFSKEEKARIVPVLQENPDNAWYEADGGEATRDSVFLLSMEQAVCDYFGDSRKNLENRSAKQRYWFQKKDANNEKRMATFKGRKWWWWTRTPGRDKQRAVYIHGDGNVGIQGNKTFRYSSTTLHATTADNSGGIRPALWLKIEQTP